MALVTRNPLLLANELQRDINRLFAQPVLSLVNNATASDRLWSPAVDIQEDDKGYYLSVDLPGIKPDKIDITAREGVLTIQGEREAATSDQGRYNRRSELTYGRFVREFHLPEGADLDNVEARSKDGVLYLIVPKTLKVQPKRISVQQ